MRGPVRARRRETGEAVSEHACVLVCKEKKPFHQSDAQVWAFAVPQPRARKLQVRWVWTHSPVPTLLQVSVFIRTQACSTILPAACWMSWFTCSNLPWSSFRECSRQVCQSLCHVSHLQDFQCHNTSTDRMVPLSRMPTNPSVSLTFQHFIVCLNCTEI